MFLYNWYHNWKYRTQYERIRQRHAELEEKNKNLDLLEVPHERMQEIAFATAIALLQGLKDGKYSSHEIVSVYVKRCVTFGRKYAWTADTLYHVALEDAKKCDVALQQARAEGTIEKLYEEKPLFGLPFSVKDHLHVKGSASTLGFLRTAFITQQKDTTTIA